MTPIFSFNLVDEPWIPCVNKDGGAIELNLREVFAQAHQLKTIAGDSPPVTASLHRFLLAILHRVFGPKDEDEWVALWESRQWDMLPLNDYLDRWRHRFDLFDEKHPFYQADDPRVRIKSTISLRHEIASGNNATLFDHHTETNGETLTPAQAARVLIAGQAYGLAGLSGIKQKFTDGACAGGILFLVTGDTLKQTLLLNMIKYPPDNDLFYVHTDLDVPAWEMADPFVPERTNPLGYLDYLTWQNRRIRFFPEQTDDGAVVREMTMGPALRLEPTLLDPMKNYRVDKKLGHIAISFRENRVFWRDFASLFALHPDMEGKARPPATFRWLSSLIDEMGTPNKEETYRTLALGMSKKQAKVFFYRQAQLPMPLTYLTNQHLVTALDTVLSYTGTIAFDLTQSVRLMGMYEQLSEVEENGWQKQWQSLNINAKNAINNWLTHTGVEHNYWASLDIPFQAFIVDLAHDEERALTGWYGQIRKSALDAFDVAADSVGNDGRSFKAVVRAHNYLTYRLNEVLPDREQTI